MLILPRMLQGKKLVQKSCEPSELRALTREACTQHASVKDTHGPISTSGGQLVGQDRVNRYGRHGIATVNQHILKEAGQNAAVLIERHKTVMLFQSQKG